MQDQKLIPHLFRTEYSKIVAVLCKSFGLLNIQLAEDLASETFLLAAETWGLKGVPENPTGWLYLVAKNKAKDALKRKALFRDKVAPTLAQKTEAVVVQETDWSEANILDSQLAMMFAICGPGISVEAQISLSLRILCGFGIPEIADALLSNKQTVNKRLYRAKEKLKSLNVQLEMPGKAELEKRLETVLTTLYLLFNEGYYSSTHASTIRKDLSHDAMRLTLLLTKNYQTNTPATNALLALMCFQASRFEARVNQQGGLVLYEEQDRSLWNDELIERGHQYLNRASGGKSLTKYHLEAAISAWHTEKTDSDEKWENILQLYNRLLQIEYSPVAALNRTYALAKTQGTAVALEEAKKLDLSNSHLYHALLAHLYVDLDKDAAIKSLQIALDLAKNDEDKVLLGQRLQKLKGG